MPGVPGRAFRGSLDVPAAWVLPMAPLHRLELLILTQLPYDVCRSPQASSRTQGGSALHLELSGRGGRR